MKRFDRLTLKNKIFVSCLGFTLVVSILIALFTRALLISSLTGELKKRGVGIAQSVAESSRVHILTKNRAELTALAYDARLGNRQKVVVYLLIADNRGTVLAHTFTTGIPEGFGPVAIEENASGEQVADMRVGPHSVFHITVPVKEGIYTIGSVQIGMDRGHIEGLIDRLRLIFLSFLSVVTLVFFFLSHRLALNITRPVTSLIRYTDHLSRGDFHFLGRTDMAPASGGLEDREDEIAILTNSFMQMTSRLASSTERLRESQQKYRSLFHSGPNPIFVIHRQTLEILDANPKAAEVFGYDRDALTGMSLLSLGNLNREAFERAYPEGKSILISSKVTLFRKDGRSLFVNIHANPAEYRDRDAIIAATTDITELVEKDDQLIQASKMANLEKMSAGIAHEINQPLNAIKMGSEYLTMMHERRNPVGPEELAMVLTEISAQVSRASEIVGRLKSFSRKADFAREVISLNRCIRSVHKIVGRQLALQNIDLTLELDEAIPAILAHNNRMEQVIFNLVTNARDAVNERIETTGDIDGGMIRITTFSDGDVVGLVVKDNGTGIPEDRKATIFDSFYTTKEMGEGLGLGLPIVQGIVRDYSGTISVTSSLGQGAAFKILFPAQTNQLPEQEH
ncbi:MAG TPA: PAS domain-containing sensor histidine kinase [Desulfobacteraceae bacterium]|nr:PAS domain-containing sensor histidine kinase [Desulfobacteraceae bacterium]|tara:strand:- start:1109 stop:2986 length:1878 start_codon:yes stop_codon:yes gene_type:complete